MCVRSKKLLKKSTKKKLSISTGIDNIIDNPDRENIYEIPLFYLETDVLKSIAEKLSLNPSIKVQISDWSNYVNAKYVNKKRIGIVGKYTHLKDSYLSLSYDIKHAAFFCQKKAEIIYIECDDKLNIHNALQSVDAIIIPGINFIFIHEKFLT